MKLSTIHTLIYALLLLLIGCSQSESLPGEEAKALLQVGTLQTAMEEGTDTRAVSTSEYPITQSIGFFVKKNTASGYDSKNNIEGTCNNNNRIWEPVTDIWLNTNNATVAVYAPYNANQYYATGDVPAAGTLKLTAGLRPADGSKDIWYKRATANNLNSPLDLTLEHAYTRLTLSVTKDVALPDAQITALELEGANIYATATLSPLEDAPYTPGTTGIAPAVTAQTIDATHTSAGYDLLLIPSTLTDDFSVTFTVNANKMRLTLSPTQFTGSKLEAGKQYKVAAKLVPGKLEVTSVTVAGWEDTLNEPDGTTSYDPPAPVDYIDIGLGFYIAPGNVMVTKNAAGVYVYSFAREQGYRSVDGSTDTFYWGTSDPDATGAASSWQEANDPCRKVGTGWHTPTKTEMDALVATSVPKSGGDWKRNNGVTVPGLYYGTASEPSEADRYKYVFLPANPTIVDTSMNQYWTSTQNYGNYIYYLFAVYSTGSVSAFVSQSDMTSYRFPIRCVRTK